MRHALVVLSLLLAVSCRGPSRPSDGARACGPPPPPPPGEVSGRQVIQTNLGDGVLSLAFGPGHLLAVGGSNRIQIWDLADRVLLRSIVAPGKHHRIAWSAPDRIVVGDDNVDLAGLGAYVEYDLDGRRVRDVGEPWHIVQTSSGGVLERIERDGDDVVIQRAGGVARRVPVDDLGDGALDRRVVPPQISADGSTVGIAAPHEDFGTTSVRAWHFTGAAARPDHSTAVVVPGFPMAFELSANGERARVEIVDFRDAHHFGATGSVMLVDTRGEQATTLAPWELSWALLEHTTTAMSPDGAWNATVVHESNPAMAGFVGDFGEGDKARMHDDEQRLFGTATVVEVRRSGSADVAWRWTGLGPIAEQVVDKVVYAPTAPVVLLVLSAGQIVVLDRDRGTPVGHLGSAPGGVWTVAIPDATHLVVAQEGYRMVRWDVSTAEPTELGDVDGFDKTGDTLELVGNNVSVARHEGSSVRIVTAPVDAPPAVAAGTAWSWPDAVVRAVSPAEGLALVDVLADRGATCAIVELRAGATPVPLESWGRPCDEPTLHEPKPIWTLRDGHAMVLQSRHNTGADGCALATDYVHQLGVWDRGGHQRLSTCVPASTHEAPENYEVRTMIEIGSEHAAAMSPDGARLAFSAGSRWWSIDVSTGHPDEHVAGAEIEGVAWLPGGDLLVTTGEGVVERWRGNTLVEHATGGVDGLVQIEAIAPDGSWFAGPGQFGSVQIWRTAPLAHVATLVGFLDREYIAYTPDGYFAGTPDVGERVAWVFDHPAEGFTFEQYAGEQRRPDIVAARIRGTAAGVAAVIRRPPHVALASSATRAGVAHVHAEATSQGRVDVVRFFVDGQPAGATGVCSARGEANVDVTLHPGVNRVTGVAYDATGLASRWDTVDIVGPRSARAPKLWVVAVGVSRYPHLDADEQLEVADADAKAIAEAFRAQAGRGAFRDPDVTVLTDGDATAPRVLAALKRLDGMAADDLAIVFMAGHGVKPGDDAGTGTGETVFLTSDASADHLERGIRWREVAASIGRARGRVIVLLDACHSGHFSRDRVVPADDIAGAFAANGRAGALVFSASKGRQLSYEPHTSRGLVRVSVPALVRPDATTTGDHGLFTAALLAGLRDPAADLDRDGELSLSEWITTVTEAVSQQTGGLQTPWVARREIHGDLRIGVSR